MENNERSQAGCPGKPGAASVAIVEDNAEIALLYTMLIESLGLRLSFVAYDGDAGVKAFRAAICRPDVVLIDHRMPIKNGLAAMEEMRALGPGTRFVFVSADESMKDKVMAAGARAFLAKPASMREISDVLTKVLAAKD
jgi:CheY-like chemotaxis protein